MKKFENIYQEADLLRKSLLEEANETERQKLEKRLVECPELRKIYEQLQNSETLKEAFEGYKNYSSEKAYQSFLQRIKQVGKREERASISWNWWYVAAAVVVLAIVSSFFVSHYYMVREAEKVLIQPGTQKAQLILSDGSAIDMRKKEIDIVVDGVRVKYEKGRLSYQPTVATQKEKENVDEVPIEPNVLTIPRGGENTVILTDGTIVHLNAGSKLTYPVRFAQNGRTVLLEGEGYFQVKEDKDRPFVVKTNFGDITVHGTEFNVSAYSDAKACYTTLVRGKVSCSNLSQETIMLSPGEQAIFAAGKLEKQLVNIEEYIGWVKGEYVFNHKSLGEIMRTFEHWYDVSVYYETPALRNLTYSGNLKRYNTINTFLDALEITGDICYKINGKNILIYENE